ncbi:MAG: hypothetical protein ACRD5Z_05380 [Bryobacteraceae bacterium]
MEILNLVDGKPGNNGRLDKTDFMNLRRLHPREKLANAQASHASEYQYGVDNLIRGLVDLMPNPNAIWPLDDRAKWLRLAAGILTSATRQVTAGTRRSALWSSNPSLAARKGAFCGTLVSHAF